MCAMISDGPAVFVDVASLEDVRREIGAKLDMVKKSGGMCMLSGTLEMSVAGRRGYISVCFNGGARMYDPHWAVFRADLIPERHQENIDTAVEQIWTTLSAFPEGDPLRVRYCSKYPDTASFDGACPVAWLGREPHWRWEDADFPPGTSVYLRRHTAETLARCVSRGWIPLENSHVVPTGIHDYITSLKRVLAPAPAP